MHPGRTVYNSSAEIAAAAEPRTPETDGEVIASAAGWAAEKAGAQAILAATMTGGTAYAVARNRPAVPVVAISPNPQSARQMALVWGVHPIEVESDRSFEELSVTAAEVARRRLEVPDGGRIVLIAGIPSGVRGGTNTMKMIKVGK